jgi:hypothetical protein
MKQQLSYQLTISNEGSNSDRVYLGGTILGAAGLVISEQYHST